VPEQDSRADRWAVYCEQVVNGDVVVSKYIRLAVERHLRDLKRQGTEEFPFHFDEEIAAQMCGIFPLVFRHSIGEHSGQPFYLEDWQQFFIGLLFGWQRDDGRGRRFRQAFFTVGRKNGKSTLAAAIALVFAAFDLNPVTHEPEERSQVILAATKREQAEKVIFAECLKMRWQAPSLKAQSNVANKMITFEHNGGNIQAVGSDRPYDGLNPSMVSLDETHAFGNPHRKFYNTMVTGSGSRMQPLLMTTTTAGDDQSHIWLEQINFCKNVLEQTVSDDTILACIYEIDEDDDPFDEDCWIKANPNLGVSITMDFLRAQCKPARASVTALNRFKRYHANVLVSSTERIFNTQHFAECSRPLSDWKSADAVSAAIDLGGRDDLAAYALCARFKTGEESGDGTPVYRYESLTRAYISSKTDRDLSAIPFCDWIAEGRIKVTDSPMMDLQSDFVDDYWKHGCFDAAIDPYQAQQFGEQVTSQGVNIATMAQTTGHFNTPITEFRRAIRDGNFSHDNDALLAWCLSNAVAVKDRQDRWMLDKANSNQKIDPLVALMMALSRVMVAPGRFGGDWFIT
jgi:phage terminase large subunit-like protein